MNIKDYCTGGVDVPGPGANFGLLVLRVFSGGAMMIAHGLPKVAPSEGFIEAVGDMGFPLPTLFAWAAALTELVGAGMVALGLWTRPAAWSVALTMFVAAFIRHASDPFQVKELALLYFAVFLFFALFGGGRWSVDAAMRKQVP
jgi:putative oxidoreductase